ncbi:hypothetical protein [Saccharicrinis aurantiacus]|uniref:hypothetical protein n=1 Tax=Saccharicrinis aurantiacus TaxID=1849719 RepID=UPI0024906F54|nr:hypothetical protein [Saccharicrinis aurantiacus]
MKNLVIAVVLLLSANTFAQELNNWQKQKLEKELTQMTEVMELNEKQVKKLTKIKTAQALDADKIMKSVTKGTAEAKKAWQDHGRKFNGQVKKVVSEEQWKTWIDSQNKNKSANNKSKANTAEGLSEQTSAYIQSKGLTSYQLGKVNKELAEMTKVMSLTQEQQIKVVDVKAAQSKRSQKIMKDYAKGSAEQKEAYDKLSKDTSDGLLEATSKKQMNMWWTYRKEMKN